MINVAIKDSGVAQLTRQQKHVYQRRTGVTKTNDQDRYVYDPDRGIFAVADGVGGSPFGAEAAQAACEAFYAEVCAGDYERLTQLQAFAVAQAGLAQIIHEAAAQTTGFTTFTGIYKINDERYAYLHAGDSQLLIDTSRDIRRVTSIQNQSGNILTNYMGGTYHRMNHTAPHPRLPSQSLTEWGTLRVQPGYRLILATDGVTEPAYLHAPDATWWRAQIERHAGAQALALALVYASPRSDDSTAIVVEFGTAHEETS